MDDKKDNKQLNIELPEELSEGTYANLAVIAHSHTEFILDFIRIVPNVPKAKVKSRVILTPQHAKRMMNALQENIRRYEEQYGNIQETNSPMPPTSFNTPKAEA
jgi:hypothetical protein